MQGFCCQWVSLNNVCTNLLSGVTFASFKRQILMTEAGYMLFKRLFRYEQCLCGTEHLSIPVFLQNTLVSASRTT